VSAPGPRAGVHPLTARQLQVLRIIERSVAARGFPPTYREFTIELGLSRRSGQTVHDHICHLAAKQLIVRHARSARAISITDAGRALLETMRATEPPPLGVTTP